MRRPVWIIVALVVALSLWLWMQPRASAPTPAPVPSEPSPVSVATNAGTPAAAPTHAEADHPATRYPAFLPAEAHEVLQRIARGGPFAYRQDGSVFQNRERRLPMQPRGYYHEYTVATPGSPDRGARRIITGGAPPEDYWYTDDHYRSFQHFEVSP
ncbi:guanyl-specific ribonuclease [Lysobacter tyrosinilyticus]